LAIEWKNVFIDYLFPNIYTYISEYCIILKNHYMLIVKYIYNVGVHVHLSECGRATWSEKG